MPGSYRLIFRERVYAVRYIPGKSATKLAV